MCTLTVVPLPGARLRLAFNRDERPTRPPALPPTRRRFGGRIAVSPLDPQSGGTWLGVNDAGLVLAVLNVTPPSPPGLSTPTPGHQPSRGLIIPALLDSETPAVALAELERAFDLAQFAPFRLVLVGQGIVAEVRWDGRQSMVTNRLLGGSPLLFTSSGLGDHLVGAARRELFDELFDRTPDDWVSAQDEFHWHRWPGLEHLSVNMSRPTARTVSHSVIDLDESAATMSYHPAAPHEAAAPTVLHLPFALAGVA